MVDAVHSDVKNNLQEKEEHIIAMAQRNYRKVWKEQVADLGRIKMNLIEEKDELYFDKLEEMIQALYTIVDHASKNITK